MPQPDYSRKYILSKTNAKVKQWAINLTQTLPETFRVFASFHVTERIVDRLNGDYAIALMVATKWIKSNTHLLTQDIDVIIRYKDFRLLMNCESYTSESNEPHRQVRLNTVLTDAETIPIREKKGKKMMFETYTVKDL